MKLNWVFGAKEGENGSKPTLDPLLRERERDEKEREREREREREKKKRERER